jgi:hypothetical protein
MTDTVGFKNLSQAERQAFAEFQLKELARHVDDIVKIVEDLQRMELVHGVKPTGKFVGRWIEI